MPSRVLTAACAMMAGAVWASGAWAAPMPRLAPGHGVLMDRTGRVFNIDLGGVSLPALAQDAESLRAAALNAGHGVEARVARGRNWYNFGNLFPGSTSLSSLYLSGTNTYGGASFALGDNVSLTAGHAILGLNALSLNPPNELARDIASQLGGGPRKVGTTSANLNWNFADWGAVALTASRSSGNGAMLGIAPGGLGAGNATETASLGISARVGFGEGWVTAVAYSDGVSQLDLSRDLMLNNPESLHSKAFGISFAKQGVFGDDALGIAISQPLRVYSGANGMDANFALSNLPAQESDVALGYVTTFLDGTLALQANAAYQVNAAGAKGQNAATAVVRARLNF